MLTPTINYEVYQYGNLNISKVDGLGNPLTGAVFSLTGTSLYGDPVNRTLDLRTLSSGSITDIPYGNYTLTETVNINSRDQSQIITNTIKLGSLRLTKVDENGNPVTGARFRLSNPSNTREFDLSQASSVTVGAIPFGTYTLTETTTPEGFVPIAPQTIEINETIMERTITNRRTSGSLTIQKTGAGGQAISGAEFTLTGINGTTGSFTSQPTGVDGRTIINDLPHGEYSIEETKVPAGYRKMNNAAVTIDSSSREISFTNEQLPLGELRIRNTREGGAPLAGAGFTAVLGDASYTSTISGADGIAVISGIPYGSYTLSETTVPEGYGKAENRTVTIGADSMVMDIANTKVPKGALSIVKTDPEGNPLTGAVFTLTGNGKTYTSTASGTDGMSSFTGVDYGAYILKETSTPAGYRYTAVPDREITINGPSQTLRITNYQPGDLTEKINLINEDEDNPGIKLSGGVFRIVGAGLTYTIEVGETGSYELENLPKGEYTVTQVRAPEGYSLMPNDLTFTLSGTPAVVHAQNKKVPGTSSLPYIRIDVKSQLDQGAIENTSIRLTGNDGSIRTGVTGKDGIALFENLDYGVTYTAAISKAPYMYTWEGSTLPQSPPLLVTTVSPVGESSLYLAPVQRNDLIIRLEELGDPAIKIQGAQFLITDPDGGTQVVVTGPDGTVDVSLWHGNYSILQITTDGTHTIDDTVYNILIQREEELIVENPLINPDAVRETVTATKTWGDPAPENPNVVIELLGNDLPTGKQQTITSGESTTITFTDLPKYDENHQRIIYSVREQEVSGYYPVYEKLDERGYSWSITNYAGEQIGECVNGAFWVSTSTSAYEISSTGVPTGRQVVLTTSGTGDINSNTYGYSIALSQDGNYLYTINRRGYLRIFDVSLPVPAEVTTTPIALKTAAGADIYSSRTDYVYAAEVSDDNTKLFVKSWKSTTIYEYDTSQLLAMASGGTLRAAQGIPSVYTAGDIVYLENGDLLVSGSAQSSLSNTGFWISKKNSNGTYAPAVKVGSVSNSLNNTKAGAIEGMGMVDGKVVITSTLSDRVRC